MTATYSPPAVSTPDRAGQLAAETADRIARMRRDGDSAWVERLTLRMAHELPETITDAERDCLIAASHGLRTAGIAALLGREPSTVQTHLTYARRRLRAKNTTHAVAIAIRMGLIA